MNLIFMGNSAFGKPILKALNDHPILKPKAVVTNPPKPMGRGRGLSETPIGEYARELKLDLIQSNSLKDPDFVSSLKDLSPDIFFVVAFRILPKDIIDIPKIGSVNLHASLLPEYRGAAPIQRAIMDGKDQTGVTTFIIEPKVDTGSILLSKTIAVNDMNFGELSEKLSEAGIDLVIESLEGLMNNSLNPIPQDHSLATPAPKINLKDQIIDWTRSAKSIHDQVRGLSPLPGAVTKLGRKRFKIYRTEVDKNEDTNILPGQIKANKEAMHVGTGNGILKILEIQREGAKRLMIEEFLRGFQNREDARFSNDT